MWVIMHVVGNVVLGCIILGPDGVTPRLVITRKSNLLVG